MAVLMAGCGSSYLQSSKNVSGQKRTYSKIFVIGHFQDRIARGLHEREIANYLGEHGIAASPSMSSEVKLDFEAEVTREMVADIRRQLIQRGYDGILVTNLLNAEEYREEIPGSFTMGTLPEYYLGFGTYIGYYPAVSWQPGEVKRGTVFMLESGLYTLNQKPDDKLQWLGRFEVKDPEDIRKATKQFAREIGKALLESSIRKR